jgi:hypothetical protein
MPEAPNDVCSISIPHTGTYFTIRLFTDAGFDETSLFSPLFRPNPTIYHGHMLKQGQIDRALELAEIMPLVIPFRHPYRVEHSWNVRARPLPEMFDCYRTLITKFLPLKPYFMPIDSPRRAEVLARISRSIGHVNLTTDGSVVNGVKGTHKMRMDEFTPSKKVVELAKSLELVMADLY